jgi:hypothetical protein
MMTDFKCQHSFVTYVSMILGLGTRWLGLAWLDLT